MEAQIPAGFDAAHPPLGLVLSFQMKNGVTIDHPVELRSNLEYTNQPIPPLFYNELVLDCEHLNGFSIFSQSNSKFNLLPVINTKS